LNSVAEFVHVSPFMLMCSFVTPSFDVVPPSFLAPLFYS
jgi:hypothetical protein